MAEIKSTVPASLPKKKLNPKQELFVREYLKDLNAKQAAIRCGFPANRARQQGHRWITEAHVSEAIINEFNKVRQKVEVNVEDILRELQIMAHFDPQDMYDENQCLRKIQDMPLAVRKNIASIECDEIWEYEQEGKKRVKVQVGVTKKIKLWPKDKGVELLGKYLAMFTDKSQVSYPDGIPSAPVEVHIHKQVITTKVEDSATRPEVAAHV